MTKAKKYLNQQLKNPEFKKSYLREKSKLDIEYGMEKLKKDVIEKKSIKEIVSEIDKIKKIISKSNDIKVA
jgi:hypothetical protein